MTIARELIEAKLQGQELVCERLDPQTAQRIKALRERLSVATSIDEVRILEAEAGAQYWSAWHDVPILWSKRDMKLIPEHWKRWGSRRSELTGGPRVATGPGNALLNYCTAILESEGYLSLNAVGLDPSMGMLHLDRANRDSLVFDVIEPVRPHLEKWLLHLVQTEPLRRADFFETPEGNCRLVTSLCARLSGTAPVLASLVAPWAERIREILWGTISRSEHKNRQVRHLPRAIVAR